MSRQKVVRSLFSFVIQNDKAVGEWNLAQFEELQLLVGGAKARVGLGGGGAGVGLCTVANGCSDYCIGVVSSQNH